MCDLLKIVFKTTILPDDVIKLISEYANVKERFNVKQLLPEYFNIVPKNNMRLINRLIDAPVVTNNLNTYPLFSWIERYLWGELEYVRYKTFIRLIKPKTFVLLSRVKQNWEKKYLFKLKPNGDTDFNYMTTDFLCLLRYNDPTGRSLVNRVCKETRELLCYDKRKRGVYICKERFDAIDWLRLDTLIKLYFQATPLLRYMQD